MFGKLLIFISSTSDLSAERGALKSLIGEYSGIYEGYFYEDDPARSVSPEERCREKIGSADVFVSVLGKRYGSPYPPPGNAGSIVEWEIETARKRPDLGLIAVVVKKLSAGEEPDPQQKVLIERVKGWRGVWCREYSQPEEAAREVLKSLMQWAGEIVLRVSTEQRDTKRKLLYSLIPQVIILTLALVALFAFNFAMALQIPPAVLVGACALECVLVLAIALILYL